MMNEDKQTRVTLHLVCRALSSTGKLPYTWCAVLYPQRESFMLQKIFGSYSGALLLRFMFRGDGTV
jgi:hypothetical protein